MSNLCFSCGLGVFEPHKAEGRILEWAPGKTFPIPADFEIPTCTYCGETAYNQALMDRLMLVWNAQAAIEAAFLDTDDGGV